MKQKIYLLGSVALMVTFCGALFKVNHWPAAGILLTLGIVSLAWLILPLALYSNYKAEEKEHPFLYLITGLTCVVVFTGMLFKLMHWPYAGIFLFIALPFPYIIFLPVFIYTTSKDKNYSINNLIAVLLLLALNSVFSGLLALNVSKERIDDSYNLVKNYTVLESELKKLPDDQSQTPVSQKIDAAIGVIESYQNIILESIGNQIQSWKENPGDLLTPDTKWVAAEAIINSGEAQYGSKLANALKELSSELNGNNDYKTLISSMPDILGFNPSADNAEEWAAVTFNDNSLVWVLTYLEGMKTDLLTLRASLL